MNDSPTRAPRKKAKLRKPHAWSYQRNRPALAFVDGAVITVGGSNPQAQTNIYADEARSLARWLNSAADWLEAQDGK